MLTRLRQHLPVVVTAVLVAALTTGGPALAAAAYDAVNADKVDGRHAVGSTATPTARAGKLVATGRDGRLPNDIIAQAPDSALLGGLGPEAFLPADGTATDAQLLDGRDSGDFLLAGGTSVDSQRLGGLTPDAFLRANGKANDADRLDGIDSSEFVRGRGQIFHGARAVEKNPNFTAFVLHTVNPAITIGYNCPADPLTQNGTVAFFNNSGEEMNTFADNGGDNPAFKLLTPAANRWNLPAAFGGEQISFQAQVPSGKVITIEVFSVHRANDCHVQATGYVSRI